MASSAHMEKIQTALFSGNLTLVVGAGISIGAVKYSVANLSENARKNALSRLRWRGLLHSGLNYLKKEYLQYFEESEENELNVYMEILSREKVALGTLVRAASLLKAKLIDCERLPDWLNREFETLYDAYIGMGGNVVLDAIRELYDANARIMTTNYDDLLSQHCKTSSIVPSQEFKLNRFFARADPRRGEILHIHGLWSEPNGAVLDSVDYFKVTQASSLQRSLQTCLVGGSEVVLFVGTGAGLDDPNFGQLLKWASPMLGQGPKRHYILLRDADKIEQKSLNVVRFGPDYSSLPSFLCMLAQSGSQRFYYDVDSKTHQSHFNRLVSDGYRLISLSVYGAPPTVRYAAIYLQGPGPDWKAIQDADAEKYEQWYQELSTQGYVSTILTATGPRNGAVYAGVMAKLSDSGEWFQHRDMSATENQNNCNTAKQNGQILVSFREYGDPSDRRYCAVWHANPNSIQWDYRDTQSYSEYQTTFNAKITTPSWRLSYATLSDDQRVSALFKETDAGAWVAKHGLLGPDLLSENRKHQKAGLSIIQLQGGGAGAETRFAALWSQKVEP
jgi:hypothetical protein